MSTITRPSLREVILDALDDAYWLRRGQIAGCRDCANVPAGVCRDHEADNDAAAEFDDARKQIERTPGHPDVLAVLGGAA